MWLAVEADGPGVRAWPVGADGSPGPAIAAPDLDRAIAAAGTALRHSVTDGDPAADAITLPARLPVRGRVAAQTGPQRLQVPRPAGLASILGAHRLAHPSVAQRPWHACLCRADGTVLWAWGAEGELRRLSSNPVGQRLAELLRGEAARGAADGDDDLGFERGLSRTESAQDVGSDLDAVLAEAQSGRLLGEAVGANLAGVLIGHDATAGLRLGRPGAPVALVGEGLTAHRYGVALGRFGVAVRRIDPPRALVAGCAWIAEATIGK